MSLLVPEAFLSPFALNHSINFSDILLYIDALASSKLNWVFIMRWFYFWKIRQIMIWLLKDMRLYKIYWCYFLFKSKKGTWTLNEICHW